MTVQDDAREIEMRTLFGLEPGEEGRGGTDALLLVGAERIPFELKSTSNTSVTTVRDFGPDHIEKWKPKHWLIGFYKTENGQLSLQRCLYGTPLTMKPWIEGREAYIKPDSTLIQYARDRIGMDAVHAILGDHPMYTLEDARRVQKRQMKVEEYRARMDVADGYSPDAMLVLVRERFVYLVQRGATLNNPHINSSYFTDAKRWPGTDAGFTSWRTLDLSRPAEHLRELVAAAVTVKEALPPEDQKKLERETREMLSEELVTGEDDP